MNTTLMQASNLSELKAPTLTHRIDDLDSNLQQNTPVVAYALQMLKSKHIFWLNARMTRLFQSMADEHCPTITRRQISRGVHQGIAALYDHFETTTQETSGSNIYHSLEQQFVEKHRIRSAAKIALKNIKDIYFNKLLHFNIRLANLIHAQDFSMAHNPIDPTFCLAIFSQQLNETVINDKLKESIILDFSILLQQQYGELLEECNQLLLELKKEERSNAERSSANTQERDRFSAKHTDERGKALKDFRENMSITGSEITENALAHSKEAIEGVLGNQPIPDLIHPFIRQWEKYLFTLYLSKGVKDPSWRDALRTLANVRRYVNGDIPKDNKQAYLDGVQTLIDNCFKGLKEMSQPAEKITKLLAPLEDIAVILLYAKKDPIQNRKIYS